MKSGEDKILELIGKYFPNTHETFYMGRGDDCALINVPHNLLAITSDIFAINAHFRTRYFTPYEIGYKSLAVNISDLASNGSLPRSFSLNLTLTDEEDFYWLEEFFHGMADLANSYNMGLLGGDLAKAPSDAQASYYNTTHSKNHSHEISHTRNQTKHVGNNQTHRQNGLNIGITAFGDYSHGGLPLLRSSSYFSFNRNNNSFFNFEKLHAHNIKKGDVLFVIGEIGQARTGLFLLEETKNQEESQKIREQYPVCTKAHLLPKPLVQEGLFLSQFAHKYPLFCMDISDGLKRDIPRLLKQEGIFSFDNTQPSKHTSKNNAYSANLTIKGTDIHEEVKKYAQEKTINPIHFAYSGGEDYGLLGTCSKEAWEELYQKWQKIPHLAKLWKIGEVCENDSPKNNSLENNTSEKNNPESDRKENQQTKQNTQTKQNWQNEQVAYIILNGEPVEGSGFDHFAK